MVSMFDSLEAERSQKLGLRLKWCWEGVHCISFQLKDLLGEVVLHRESLVGVIEFGDYPRVVALDTAATELLNRRHGVAEDGVQCDITPQSTMIGALPLDSIMECCIATSHNLDRPSNEDTIDGAAASNMGAGSIGSVGREDGVSHVGSLEKF